jgi:hypothetical protein
LQPTPGSPRAFKLAPIHIKRSGIGMTGKLASAKGNSHERSSGI